jgi:hypothetical protein
VRFAAKFADSAPALNRWVPASASIRLAAPEPISRHIAMKIVLIVDVGRIAFAIFLILELLK